MSHADSMKEFIKQNILSTERVVASGQTISRFKAILQFTLGLCFLPYLIVMAVKMRRTFVFFVMTEKRVVFSHPRVENKPVTNLPLTDIEDIVVDNKLLTIICKDGTVFKLAIAKAANIAALARSYLK